MRKYFYYSAGLIGFLVIATSLAGAADYYVSSSQGNDNNPGTVALPWKTIGKANNALQAGDTVYLRAGTYAETIRPVKNGVGGKYITFEGYQNDTVLFTGAFGSGASLGNKSYVKIRKIFFGTVNDHWIDFEPGGSHNIIEYCDFKAVGTTPAYEGILIKNDANYNIIRHCSLSTPCKPNNGIHIEDSDYNIVEHSNFGTFEHDALDIRRTSAGTADYNIVRNNTFANLYHHNISLYKAANHTLVEYNLSYDAGALCEEETCTASACRTDLTSPNIDHQGIKIASDYCIVRNNIFAGNRDNALAEYHNQPYTSCTYNRLYNNVFYDDGTGLRVTTDEFTTHPLNYNILKNNIFSSSKQNLLVVSPDLVEADNQFDTNNFYNGSIIYKRANLLSAAQESYPDEIFNSFSVDPKFVNASSRNFALLNSSLMIDSGAWLTTVTSASGSGVTFVVADAKYFMDGWGIIEGDLIQLEGQTQTSRITAINYDTHTITVDRTLSWRKGQGVSLPYNGAKPDIGAYEYAGPSSPSPSAPKGLGVK